MSLLARYFLNGKDKTIADDINDGKTLWEYSIVNNNKSYLSVNDYLYYNNNNTIKALTNKGKEYYTFSDDSDYTNLKDLFATDDGICYAFRNDNTLVKLIDIVNDDNTVTIKTERYGLANYLSEIMRNYSNVSTINYSIFDGVELDTVQLDLDWNYKVLTIFKNEKELTKGTKKYEGDYWVDDDNNIIYFDSEINFKEDYFDILVIDKSATDTSTYKELSYTNMYHEIDVSQQLDDGDIITGVTVDGVTMEENNDYTINKYLGTVTFNYVLSKGKVVKVKRTDSEGKTKGDIQKTITDNINSEQEITTKITLDESVYNPETHKIYGVKINNTSVDYTIDDNELTIENTAIVKDSVDNQIKVTINNGLLYTKPFYFVDHEGYMYKLSNRLNLIGTTNKSFDIYDDNFYLFKFDKYTYLLNSNRIIKVNENKFIKGKEKVFSIVFDYDIIDPTFNHKGTELYMSSLNIFDGGNNVLSNRLFNSVYNATDEKDSSLIFLIIDRANEATIKDFKFTDDYIYATIEADNFSYLYKFTSDGNLLYSIQIGGTLFKKITTKMTIVDDYIYYGNEDGEVITIYDDGSEFTKSSCNKYFYSPVINISNYQDEVLIVSKNKVLLLTDNFENRMYCFECSDCIVNAYICNYKRELIIVTEDKIYSVRPSMISINDGIIGDCCYKFSGDNSHVTIDQPFKSTDSELSLSLWIKPTSFDYNKKVIYGGQLPHNWNNVVYADGKIYLYSLDITGKMYVGTLNDDTILWTIEDISESSFSQFGYVNAIRRYIGIIKDTNKFTLGRTVEDYDILTLRTSYTINKYTYINSENVLYFLCNNSNQLISTHNVTALESVIYYNYYDLPVTDTWKNIIKFKSVYTLAGSYYLLRSTDLDSWTIISNSTNEILSLVYNDDVMLYVNEDSIYYTNDGSKWYEAILPENNLTLVKCIYVDTLNMFITITKDSNSIIYSYDGATWYKEQVIDKEVDMADIYYADGVVVISLKEYDQIIVGRIIDGKLVWKSYNIGNNGNDLAIYIDEDNKLAISLGYNKYETEERFGSDKVDTWNNIIVTYNHSLLGVYVNGNCVERFTTDEPLSFNDKYCCLGDVYTGNDSNKYNLYAELNDIQFFNHVLSLKEIDEINQMCVIKHKMNDIHYKTNVIKYFSDNGPYSNDYTLDDNLNFPYLDNQYGLCYGMNGKEIINENVNLTNKDTYTISFWYKNNSKATKDMLRKTNNEDGWYIRYNNNSTFDTISFGYNYGSKTVKYKLSDYEKYYDSEHVNTFKVRESLLKSFFIYDTTSLDNPYELMLYEIVDGDYVLTTDRSPVTGKTYYNNINSDGDISSDGVVTEVYVDGELIDDSEYTIDYTTLLEDKHGYYYDMKISILDEYGQEKQLNWYTKVTIGIEKTFKNETIIKSENQYVSSDIGTEDSAYEPLLSSEEGYTPTLLSSIQYKVNNFNLYDMNLYTITYNDGDIMIYVNGMPVAKNSNIKYQFSDEKLIIGSESMKYDLFKDIRMYHRVLNNNDIVELYKQGNILDRNGKLYTYNLIEDTTATNINVNKLNLKVKSIEPNATITSDLMSNNNGEVKVKSDIDETY